MGRYPDGSNQVYQFSLPTIGKTNLMTKYSFAIDEGALQGIQSGPLLATKRPFVRYVMGELVVRCEQTASAGQVSIYQLSGQMVGREAIDLAGGYAAVPLRHLSRGCYIAKVELNDGTAATCKFLID